MTLLTYGLAVSALVLGAAILTVEAVRYWGSTR